MRYPGNQAEWTHFVKSNYWTIAIALLTLIVVWQGLTLYLQKQSWNDLEKRVDSLLEEGASKGVSEATQEAQDSPGRTVEATFFYHPKPQYTLSAILDDRAVITAKFHGREVKNQEVKAGDRIEMATVESIDSNGVTLREDGADAPKRITLHPEQ